MCERGLVDLIHKGLLTSYFFRDGKDKLVYLVGRKLVLSQSSLKEYKVCPVRCSFSLHLNFLGHNLMLIFSGISFVIQTLHIEVSFKTKPSRNIFVVTVTVIVKIPMKYLKFMFKVPGLLYI